ncbi:hypothetical protein G9C98_008269 [Cotesia typhae]|uniref:ZSWIM1/3 RNaseH-like domain-containing protein n=1 Tax=Cotesia typhae TaxID=2053667 RepID=A0A8J5UVR9_9HYME|nr:hypothetical protein G9C98_008269 [Cotesia typhae]
MKVLFDYLPENRRLFPGTIEKTVSCLKLKPNNKYLQDKIIRETGADVTILSTGSDLLGLYFSTPEMRNAMTAWPENIFMDGTHNLLDTNLVTMILIVEDSNGITVYEFM